MLGVSTRGMLLSRCQPALLLAIILTVSLLDVHAVLLDKSARRPRPVHKLQHGFCSRMLDCFSN